MRVGGGAPIFSRAAAFTAEAALNGFGLRGFDGIALPPDETNRILTAGGMENAAQLRLEPTHESQPPHGRGAGWRGGCGTGWAEDRYSLVGIAVRLGDGTDLDSRVHVIAPGDDRLLVQFEQLRVLHRVC